MNNAVTQVIVPTDKPSVFAALNTMQMANGTQLAIVRPQNPPPGIGGFIFDIVDEDMVQLESSISVYNVSSNTPITDHISLAPEVVSVGGTIAEVVITEVVTQPISPVTNPLPNLPGMGPQTDTQQPFSAPPPAPTPSEQSLWSYYLTQSPQQPNQTKQSLAFGYIYQLWKGRQLFTVETPWGFFTNMALKTSGTTQGERSRWSSQAKLTFQKVNYANTPTVQPATFAGRLSDQMASVTTAGNLQSSPANAQQINYFTQQITLPASGGNP